MHSQRLSEKLLTPWIICEKQGTIISAHCDCIAGLGEVCTHVASVLFAIDDFLRKVEEPTPTGVKAYWMPPTNKPIEPKRVHEIDFSTSKKKCFEEVPIREREAEKLDIPPLSSVEKHNLLKNLEDSGSVLHLITPPFSGQLMETMYGKKSLNFSTLFKEEYANFSLAELHKVGKYIKNTWS